MCGVNKYMNSVSTYHILNTTSYVRLVGTLTTSIYIIYIIYIWYAYDVI